MRRKRVQIAGVVAILAIAAAATTTALAGGEREVRTRLTGFQEVPAISTDASGKFSAKLRTSSEEIRYELSYADLTGAVQQAHIHIGQRSVNGGISVFLCSNLGNGPAGTQACPPPPATITGTIRPADVIGPAGQGIDPMEFDELVRAIEAGVAYANVHSETFPNGEIRGQLRDYPDPGGRGALGRQLVDDDHGQGAFVHSHSEAGPAGYLERPVVRGRQGACERRVEQLERGQPARQL
jgi:CHRD domain